jgi:hypothetical protein
LKRLATGSTALTLALALLAAACRDDEKQTQAPAADAALAAPAALDSIDFTVRGVDGGMLAAQARGLLGAPDSIVESPHPHDHEVTLPRWDFADLQVHLTSNDVVAGVSLTGPGAATHRGVRVGDSVQRVRERYGEPSRTDTGAWTYLDPADEAGLHVVMFFADADRVPSIFLGTLLD